MIQIAAGARLADGRAVSPVLIVTPWRSQRGILGISVLFLFSFMVESVLLLNSSSPLTYAHKILNSRRTRIRR